MAEYWVERVKDRMKSGPWKMTLGSLASEIGVSRSTLDRWFDGSQVPRLTEAIKLANLFDCSLDELFRPEWWGKQKARDIARRTIERQSREDNQEGVEDA